MGMRDEIRKLYDDIRQLAIKPSRAAADKIKREAVRVARKWNLPGTAQQIQEALVYAMQASFRGKVIEAKAMAAYELHGEERQRVRDGSRFLVNWLLSSDIPIETDRAKKDIDFVLVVALRGYKRVMDRKVTLTQKHFKLYAAYLVGALQNYLHGAIMQNVKKSIKEGGPLSDDVDPKKGPWAPLSRRYTKYHPRKKRQRPAKFGVLTGGMMRNLHRGGALKIHWQKGQVLEGGAREFSVDFSTSKWGRKLARFHFGRSPGRGRQPARNVTFLTQRNFRYLTGIVKSTFDKIAKDTYSIFAGEYVGRMPTIKAVGPKGARQFVRPAPRFVASQIWSPTGLEGADIPVQ